MFWLIHTFVQFKRFLLYLPWAGLAAAWYFVFIWYVFDNVYVGYTWIYFNIFLLYILYMFGICSQGTVGDQI